MRVKEKKKEFLCRNHAASAILWCVTFVCVYVHALQPRKGRRFALNLTACFSTNRYRQSSLNKSATANSIKLKNKKRQNTTQWPKKHMLVHHMSHH